MIGELESICQEQAAKHEPNDHSDDSEQETSEHTANPGTEDDPSAIPNGPAALVDE